MHLKILKEIQKNHKEDNSDQLVKYTNKFIKNVTNNLENFSYNKIVANMHEMYSFFNKELEKNFRKNTLEENYVKILIAIMPVLPHFSQECLQTINTTTTIEWPSFNEKLFEKDNINIVVQINGKKRNIIQTNKNLSEEDLLKIIIQDEKLKKYLEHKAIKKKIYVQDKLINIIL